MSEPYRLVRQLSSGPDGVSYLGVDERDQRSVTVDRLFLARRFPPRWAELSRRLQLVSRLSHAHVLPVRTFQDDDDPYVVSERLDKTLADACEAGEVEAAQALDWVQALAEALLQGHRLGLVHGELCPGRIVMAEGARPLADLCGIRTGSAQPLGERDRIFCDADRRAPSPASDVFALGALCVYLLTRKVPALPDDPLEPIRVSLASGTRLESLLAEMLDRDPDRRPSIHEVVDRLRRVDVARGPGSESTAVILNRDQRDPLARDQVGRFRVRELLGEGAMGRVHRAEDTAGGPDVALKLLRPQWAEERDALIRFYREARVLSELDNPHIARFVEVNQDAGLHYLAMEYVDGQSLDALIDQQRTLPVEQALELVRDIAYALADVHDLGVIHRDIKPANVLLVRPSGDALRAKLCDFGIARPVAVQAGEELTEMGIALGTPHYMAPEQCMGAEVDASSDIYALGITLYKMLVGNVPFNATDPRAIIYKHLTEPVPPILELCPELGAEHALVLERMLAKNPVDRFANGRALLDALEKLRRGEPASMDMHPRAPAVIEGRVHSYDFEWRLSAPPAALWPYVSNTERLNRAIGLDAVDFRRRVRDGYVETYGKLRSSGMTLDWREHPFEWVAPKRLGVLREFSAGPFVWLKSTVELEPLGGGTLLKHQIQIEPRGVLGRAAASMEVGFKARRNLERVYQRIDRFVGRERGPSSSVTGTMVMELDDPASTLDPFETASMPSEHQLARIAAAQDRLLDHGISDEVAARLCDFLRWASPQDVARIRPRAFARRFAMDHREVLRACLHASKHGLLVLLWDVICPRCQIASSIEESLRALKQHTRCDACDLGFELDFGNTVEIVFRAHPEVRESELGTFCVGGPGHSPHVLAQIRLGAGERFALELALPEGAFRIAGRGFDGVWAFSVRADAALSQWELGLGRGAPQSLPRALTAGRQRITFVNEFDAEVLARVERLSPREDAVTAAEAACTALFRELFPSEVLAPGQLLGLSKVALVVVELGEAWSRGANEVKVFARLLELERRASEAATREGGALVKLIGDGLMLSFADAGAAVRTALALVEPEVRIAAHTGAAMATSINDRLDYFGRMVRELMSLASAGERGQLVLSEALCADPAVAAMLAATRHEPTMVFAGGIVAQALTPSAS